MYFQIYLDNVDCSLCCSLPLFDLRVNKRLRKNREAGDLGRHHAHYDIIVMLFILWNDIRNSPNSHFRGLGPVSV